MEIFSCERILKNCEQVPDFVWPQALDSSQLAALTSHSGATSPLWLTTACDELRVFGDFSRLTRKIQSLGDDFSTLISDILDRILAEDREGLAKEVRSKGSIFTILWTSVEKI